MLILPPIYAITDRAVSGIEDHIEIARRLLSVGIRLLQIREKGLPDRVLLESVEAAARLARAHSARLLVNDRVDIARLAGVGAHLGENDLPASVARRLLPESALIGVSTHDVESSLRAFRDPDADYVAFGPVFASSTKTIRPPRGLEDLARAAASKTKPLVAIGGITLETLEAVLDAGADSAAMVAGLLAGGDLEGNARRALDHSRRRSRPGRIYLVGFMGSGKSAVGRRVAERLGVPFVDLDAEIERTSGATVRALFESAGEAAFRRREALFLEATEALPDAIVATGGGCYTFEENRRSIARLGTAVFLDTALPVLLSRLTDKKDRPLFEGPAEAARLCEQRVPFYRMAPVRVILGGESIEEAADSVLVALQGGVLGNRRL